MRTSVLFVFMTACAPAVPVQLSDTDAFLSDVVEYQPRFPLASGVNESRRRFYTMPPGTQIDQSNWIHWEFPVGTRFFKEFGLDGRRIETRMIERVSEDEYFMAAFLWREDQSDADLVLDGAVDKSGHVVPAADQCMRCHQGEPGRILGFSDAQMSDDPVDAPEPVVAGLAYLHGNCGHCHGANGSAAYVGMNLRLMRAHGPFTPEIVMRTLEGREHRILERMASTDARQMPPIGRNTPDEHGIEIVRTMFETR